MTAYLLVGLGAALGGMLRHWFAGIEEVGVLEPHELPWGTVLANLAGSFVIGFAAALPLPLLGEPARLLVMTGFCGGFTTFSSFSLQNILLLQEGDTIPAVWNILVSVVAGTVAAILGFLLGGRFS
ncbi:MAG: fluoride efflux transporter CrcB [Azospirillum sp.]|nr:fluoride efflux transporter CrcB [Azospirillum sp.]